MGGLPTHSLCKSLDVEWGLVLGIFEDLQSQVSEI